MSRDQYRKLRRHNARPAGFIAEHLVVAEKALGKPLPKGAQVHHVDGNKRNNANRNLVICQDQPYRYLLHLRAEVVRAGANPNTHKMCRRCHTPKPLNEFGRHKTVASGLRSECKACSTIEQASRWQRILAARHVA